MHQPLRMLCLLIFTYCACASTQAIAEPNQETQPSKVDIDERSLKLCRRQYQSRKPERALKHCIKAAKSGSIAAHVMLGFIYRNGLIVLGMRDRVPYPELAYKSFLKAAVLGHPQAHYLVGQMLEQGIGVEQNEQEGWVWKQRALQLGYKPELKTIIEQK